MEVVFTGENHFVIASGIYKSLAFGSSFAPLVGLMACQTPPPTWVREGKLAAYFDSALPPAVTPYVSTIGAAHLGHIRDTLAMELTARCGTLGLPPSETALAGPVATALTARAYGAWWTKSKLTAVRLTGFAPANPFPADFQTTPPQGLMMPLASSILVAGTGLINQYSLRRRVLTGVHLNNSLVPNPVHYRTALEHRHLAQA